MKALLTGVGSRGDIQPILALALGLRRAGHQVKLCLSSNGRAAAEANQFEFIDLGLDIETVLRTEPGLVQRSALKQMRRLHQFLQELIELQFAVYSREMPWADITVGGGPVVAACSVAEALRKPYRFAVYCAQAVRSRSHAPYTIAAQGTPAWLNRALWVASDAMVKLFAKKTVNRHRAALGLSPMGNVSNLFAPAGQLIFAADPELSEPPLDWDREIPVTGPWMMPAIGVLDPEVQRFIDAGEKPVYFGFGSMTDENAAATTRLVLEAAAQAKVRLLLSSGWAGLGAGELPPGCKVIGETPHGILFPKLAGVVHHGGAGTLATSTRAGVPQLLIPHLMDQHYWAYRIARAGMGPRAIVRRRLTRDALVRGLSELVSNPTYRERASRFAESVRTRDGVANAVALLERTTR